MCIKSETKSLLNALGLSAKYAGYGCIVQAVDIAYNDPQALTLVSKRLYPEVARRCGSTPMSVERNIRTAIAFVWKASPGRLQELTQFPIQDKPPSAQFIAILVSALQQSAP